MAIDAPLRCILIDHSAFSVSSVRYVFDQPANLALTLEDGNTESFVAAGDGAYMEVSDDGGQLTYRVRVPAVPLMNQLELARGSTETVKAVFRLYALTNTAAPLEGPIRLTVGPVTQTGAACEFEAWTPNYGNIDSPRLIYTRSNTRALLSTLT